MCCARDGGAVSVDQRFEEAAGDDDLAFIREHGRCALATHAPFRRRTSSGQAKSSGPMTLAGVMLSQGMPAAFAWARMAASSVAS